MSTFIQGTSGNNLIYTGDDDFFIVDAGAGNDIVIVGNGGGIIDAGAGNDSVTVGYGQSTVDGGAGTDTLGIDWTGGYALSAKIAGTLYAAGSSYASIQNALAASGGSYVLFDDYYGNYYSVTHSNIEQFNIQGSNSNDNLLIFKGQGGSYRGGSSIYVNLTDTLYADWSSATSAITWVNNPSGIDQVVNGVTVSGIERLLLSTGSGDDVLDNSASGYIDDTFITGAGNDSINAGDGSDFLDGGTGVDTLIGGAGDDTYQVDNAGDVITEAMDEGSDTVQSSITWALGAELENLMLTGAVAIDGTGNSANNAITGNSAANVLDGGAGADSLVGGAGNDTLKGGTGNDTLDGGDGADYASYSVSDLQQVFPYKLPTGVKTEIG